MMDIRFVLPRFPQSDAARFAEDYYNIRGTLRALPSERDQNFLLTSDSGPEYVLKIANANESEEILKLQNLAMLHLAKHAPALRLPRVVSSRSGETILSVPDETATEHFLRLLTYVPGTVLATVRPHTPELLKSLGQTLGTLSAALQSLEHAAAHRPLKWDLARAGWIRDYLQYIGEPGKRQMVQAMLDSFETSTCPSLSTLRKSVTYNDANDYNVMVDRVEKQNRVVGVIDFGDMVYTNTVCDLAVGIAYAILAKPDPITAAASIVSGYNEVFALAEEEIAALFPLICARLCTTVSNAAYQRSVAPENTYLGISEEPAWLALSLLSEINPEMAHARFRYACGLSPTRNSRAVANWLRSKQGQFGKLLDMALSSEEASVVDLSVGSPLTGNLAEISNTEALTRRIQDAVRASHARIGIGRYNEARVLTTSGEMRVEGNNGPEWRTIHIGLDLFCEPGTPIYAPWDGRIHSFKNNSAPGDYGPTLILEHRTDDGLPFYTLYGYLTAASLDALAEGKVVARGTRMAEIGTVTENGGWPPHLHFQILTETFGMHGDFSGNVLPSLRNFYTELCPDPGIIAGIPEETLRSPVMSAEKILKLRSEFLSDSLSISYKKPLHIVRGSMQYLYDEYGRAYLDCVNNVAHVGHSHPRVVRAGQAQMEVLNTNTRYLHEGIVEYAKRLCATLPDPLSVCFFVNSGSEANELALRLARTHTGGSDFIVLDAGYHGNTGALIDASSYKFDGPGGFAPPGQIHKAPIPDVYRGMFRKGDPQSGAKYAEQIEDSLSQIRNGGKKLAGFLCEAMPGCGGQIIFPEGYMHAAYEKIRRNGGVCIADEVQTGFGRPGTHFWAFETQDVFPDIVTMGKPIGNGHPIGAVVTTRAIADSFHNGMEYFNTFGGNPVSCAIGLAVLDVIADQRLQESALRIGSRLMARLREIQQHHLLIGDVRGSGLYIGVELVRNRETLAPAFHEATYIINRMRELGILLSTDGPLHNVLKIKPPLVFTEQDVEFLVSNLNLVLQEEECKSL